MQAQDYCGREKKKNSICFDLLEMPTMTVKLLKLASTSTTVPYIKHNSQKRTHLCTSSAHTSRICESVKAVVMTYI